MNINEQIDMHCTNLCDDYNIDILFAIESGSRLWRMNSSDSDYDVRLVYKYPISDYLRIHNRRGVINKTVDDIDIVGFDLYKFIRLLINSNPSIIEWLNSDIVYIDDNYSKEFLSNFITDNFNPIALFHHYRSMCKNNYLSYLKSSRQLTYKKYLYAMRGLVNAKWVAQKMSIPPIRFIDAVKEVQLDDDVRNKIFEVIDIKKDGCEGTYISKLHLFENYIEDFLDTKYKMPSFNMQNVNTLQDFVYETLGVY